MGGFLLPVLYFSTSLAYPTPSITEQTDHNSLYGYMKTKTGWLHGLDDLYLLDLHGSNGVYEVLWLIPRPSPPGLKMFSILSLFENVLAWLCHCSWLYVESMVPSLATMYKLLLSELAH